VFVVFLKILKTIKGTDEDVSLAKNYVFFAEFN